MTTKRLSEPYGDYAVTSDGKVISYKRNEEGEPVAQKVDKDGYPQVNLSNNEEAHGFKVFRVHDLVARAFLGPRPEGAEVLHKDGTRDNCAASNLKYGTRSENATQREADKRTDSVDDGYIRLDSSFKIGKWERTPEGYLKASAVVAREAVLQYPEEGRSEYVDERALRTGAESMLYKPVVFEHPPGGEVDETSWQTYAKGMVVESRYDTDLRAHVVGIVVSDGPTIKRILEDNITEVSPGYRAAVVADPTYGYRQVRRFSNHLAITRAGRGGPEAAIRLDSKGRTQEGRMTEEEMKAKVDAANAERADALKKIDALQAKVDAFEKMASKDKDEEDEKKTDSRFVAMFNERIAAQELAKQIGAPVRDDMTNTELKAAIVNKAVGTALRVDSAAALQGAYEAVRAMTPAKNTPDHLAAAFRQNQTLRNDAVQAPADDLFAIYNDAAVAAGQFQFQE